MAAGSKNSERYANDDACEATNAKKSSESQSKKSGTTNATTVVIAHARACTLAALAMVPMAAMLSASALNPTGVALELPENAKAKRVAHNPTKVAPRIHG